MEWDGGIGTKNGEWIMWNGEWRMWNREGLKGEGLTLKNLLSMTLNTLTVAVEPAGKLLIVQTTGAHNSISLAQFTPCGGGGGEKQTNKQTN